MSRASCFGSSKVTQPGENIGGCELARKLGEGPFGIVWLARDPSGSSAVVKLMREDFARRESGRQAFSRLKRAVKSHARLQHEALPYPLKLVDEPARFFFGVMRAYVVGRSLAEVHLPPLPERDRDPRTLATLVGWFAELGELLGWLHERSAIHGNLKPTNVMLERLPDRHQVRLLDLSWSAIGLAGPQPGVPSFLSPEQLEGEAPSFASDQWALATMLSRIVRPEAGPADPSDLSEALISTLNRATRPAPDRRFPTVRGFAAALRTVQEDLLSGQDRFGRSEVRPALASQGEVSELPAGSRESQALSAVHVPQVRPLVGGGDTDELSEQPGADSKPRSEASESRPVPGEPDAVEYTEADSTEVAIRARDGFSEAAAPDVRGDAVVPAAEVLPYAEPGVVGYEEEAEEEDAEEEDALGYDEDAEEEALAYREEVEEEALAYREEAEEAALAYREETEEEDVLGYDEEAEEEEEPGYDEEAEEEALAYREDAEEEDALGYDEYDEEAEEEEEPGYDEYDEEAEEEEEPGYDEEFEEEEQGEGLGYDAEEAPRRAEGGGPEVEDDVLPYAAEGEARVYGESAARGGPGKDGSPPVGESVAHAGEAPSGYAEEEALARGGDDALEEAVPRVAQESFAGGDDASVTSVMAQFREERAPVAPDDPEDEPTAAFVPHEAAAGLSVEIGGPPEATVARSESSAPEGLSEHPTLATTDRKTSQEVSQAGSLVAPAEPQLGRLVSVVFEEGPSLGSGETTGLPAQTTPAEEPDVALLAKPEQRSRWPVYAAILVLVVVASVGAGVLWWHTNRGPLLGDKAGVGDASRDRPAEATEGSDPRVSPDRQRHTAGAQSQGDRVTDKSADSPATPTSRLPRKDPALTRPTVAADQAPRSKAEDSGSAAGPALQTKSASQKETDSGQETASALPPGGTGVKATPGSKGAAGAKGVAEAAGAQSRAGPRSSPATPASGPAATSRSAEFAPAKTPSALGVDEDRLDQALAKLDRRAQAPGALEAEECEAGSKEACMALARFYIERGDVEETQDAYSRACGLGSPEGCLKAAQLLEREVGELEADAQAFVMYKKGCALGSGSACYRAAIFVEERRGGGAAEDASSFRRKACALGVEEACTQKSTGSSPADSVSTSSTAETS